MTPLSLVANAFEPFPLRRFEGRPEIRKQIARHQQWAIAQGDRALHSITEFTDVAGPTMSQRGLKGQSARPLNAISRILGHLGDEAINQPNDVLAAVAQRRNRNMHNVDPVQQVFPERAFPSAGGRRWLRKPP